MTGVRTCAKRGINFIDTVAEDPIKIDCSNFSGANWLVRRKASGQELAQVWGVEMTPSLHHDIPNIPNTLLRAREDGVVIVHD